jgi:hypothetical protein
VGSQVQSLPRPPVLSGDSAVNLLVELILEAVRMHERYARKGHTFVPLARDETGCRRWSKADEAQRFFKSAISAG